MGKRIKILGIPFCNFESSELVKELRELIENKRKIFLVTANPEIVMYANKDITYKKIIIESNYIIADGIGVVIASKIIGTPLKQRIAGFDLMKELLAHANEKQLSVYFLGAKQEVITKAVENIQKSYPKIKIAGYHNGYFNKEQAKMIKNEIIEKSPNLVFVALGFPNQEKWIYNNLGSFNQGLFMGVGGSFDVWAGVVKRAPILWQKLHIEWLYRLIQQPSRWKRMLVLPQFLIKVIREK